MRVQVNIGETPTTFELPDGSTPQDIEDVAHHYMQNQSPMIGATKDIWSDTKEAASNAINSTTQALSEPLNNPNAEGMMAIPDAAIRTVGKVGNAIGGLTSLAFSPVQGALTASVANSGIIPATASAIKNNLVPNDPRFSADISPEAQHQVAQGIGADMTNTVGLGMGANQGTKMANSVPEPPPISAIDRTSATKNSYAAVGQNKDIFPNLGADYAKIIDEAKAQPLPNGKLTQENQTLNNHLDDFSGLEGKPLTIEHANQIDRDLGQKINNAFSSGDKTLATKLMGVQDDFRDALSGTQAGDTLSDARTLAANDFRVNDLEKIVKDSKNYDNPATYIKNQFRNIAQNPRRLSSYPPEAQAAIKGVAESGVVGDVLGIAGSRLGGIIGGAVGGPAGAAAANAVGFASRGTKNAVYINGAQKAINATNNAVRPLIEKYNMNGPAYVPRPPEPLQLSYQPQPSGPIGVNTAGTAVTAADRAIIGQAPAAPLEPTLQEIQQMPFEQGKVALDNYLRRKNTRR